MTHKLIGSYTSVNSDKFVSMLLTCCSGNVRRRRAKFILMSTSVKHTACKKIVAFFVNKLIFVMFVEFIRLSEASTVDCISVFRLFLVL
jgi:hypothetical protein